MAQITLDIPDDVAKKLASEGMEIDRLVPLAAAFSLCSRGELSTSQAARLAGLTYADFLEAAARAKVELFPVDIEELKEEIRRGFTLGRQCIAGHPPRQDRSA
jgi:predicted HTH domain antitoxin